MNKPLRSIARLQVPSQQASSKPPLGPSIGQLGVPIMDFCNLFNKLCAEQQFKPGILVNCFLYLYKDFSFDLKIHKVNLIFLLKTSWFDTLLSDKKKLSTKKGRVQAMLFGSFKRKKRSNKKKINFLWISTYALYELSKMYYFTFNLPISFYSFYKTTFGFIKSAGFLVIPSTLCSIRKKQNFFFFLPKTHSLNTKVYFIPV
jgi:ribosomal protein L11